VKNVETYKRNKVKKIINVYSSGTAKCIDNSMNSYLSYKQNGYNKNSKAIRSKSKKENYGMTWKKERW
jgi:hypothetical protein